MDFSLRSLPSLLCALTFSSLLQTAHASTSAGCGQAIPSGSKIGASNTASLTTTISGTTRTYRVYVPKLYSTSNPSPLIINYHGRGSNGQQQEQMTGMSVPNVNNDTIVIYPDGLNQEWEGDPDVTNVDDVAFTSDLVTKISGQYCVDSSRIYAVGSSNGGGFVGNYLACSDYGTSTFAVFGAAYGAFYTNTTAKVCDAPAVRGSVAITADNVPIVCNATKQDVPMIEFHGTGDQTIPYTGGDRRGFCLPAIPHFVTNWASRAGLGTTNTSKSLFDGKAFKFEFGSGTTQGKVTHYEIINMPHTWPVTTGNISPFNATPVVLDFFRTWGPGDGKGVTSSGTTNAGASGSGTASASSTTTKKSGAVESSQPLLSIFMAMTAAFTFVTYVL